MAAMTGTPEPIGPVRAQLGEGPCWDDRTGRLHWLDITGKSIHTTDPADGTTTTVAVPTRPTALAPAARAGTLVVAFADGIGILDGDRIAARHGFGLAPGVRLNDGAADPDGRFWVGSMAEDERPGLGHLYRVGGGTVDVVLDGVWLANGIDWSPAGDRMYFVDSLARRVDAFDFFDGVPTGRRVFAAVPAAAGVPDGLTVDADGGVWVALFGGGAVHRYDPDGRLDRVLAVPADNVTACAFGGPGRDMLFVTTAAERVAAERRDRQPHAGAVFAVAAGRRGNPTRYVGLSHLPAPLAG